MLNFFRKKPEEPTEPVRPEIQKIAYFMSHDFSLTYDRMIRGSIVLNFAGELFIDNKIVSLNRFERSVLQQVYTDAIYSRTTTNSETTLEKVSEYIDGYGKVTDGQDTVQ